MAKIRSYRFGGYTIPSDPEVVGLRVRTSPSPFTGAPSDYDIPFDDIGLAAEFSLPLPHTPLLDQNLHIALSTVDNAGNESDLLYQAAGAPFMFPFDLIAPPPPSGALVLV